MNGKTHLLGGVTAGLLIISQTDPTVAEGIVSLSLCAIGSLWPDIDIEQSTISQMLKPISIIHVAIGKKLKCGGHRGITHSLLYALLLSAPLLLLNWKYAVSLFVGLLSHMILDMISGGVKLLAPFYDKRITIGKIKVDTLAESLVYLAESIAFAYIGFHL